MNAQREAGVMVPVSRMNKEQLDAYIEAQLEGLEPELREQMVAEYLRPLEPEMDAPSTDVHGGHEAVSHVHGGTDGEQTATEPASPSNTPPHSHADSRSETNTPDWIRTLHLNMQRQAHVARQQREELNGEHDADYDDSDEGAANRAYVASLHAGQPESEPHGTYTALQRQRRSLFS